MTQLQPLDPDDALTVDGADLLAEIRALQRADRGDRNDQHESGELTHDPAHTAPTQERWTPPAVPTDDVVDTSGTNRPLSRSQRVAIALALLLGLGAAFATWRHSAPATADPPAEAVSNP